MCWFFGFWPEPLIVAGVRVHDSLEAHLQAYTRSHLPDFDRPFECPEDGRSRKFWTVQHRKVHEPAHEGEKPWKMVLDLNPPLGCSLNRLCDVQERVVSRLLRNIITLEHTSTMNSPVGTKLYRCERSDYSKSFNTRSYGLARRPMTKSGTLARIRPAFRCTPYHFSPPGRSSRLIRGPHTHPRAHTQNATANLSASRETSKRT